MCPSCVSFHSSTRKLAPSSVEALLDELKRDPGVATFCAFHDFAYKGRHVRPKVEREYWLKLSGTKLLAGGLSAEKLPGLRGADGLIIMHVHYADDHPCPADPRRPKIGIEHRGRITQINMRHTWQSSGPKFPSPCKDPGGGLQGLFREGFGSPVLVDDGGWDWMKPGEERKAR